MTKPKSSTSKSSKTSSRPAPTASEQPARKKARTSSSSSSNSKGHASSPSRRKKKSGSSGGSSSSSNSKKSNRKGSTGKKDNNAGTSLAHKISRQNAVEEHQVEEHVDAEAPSLSLLKLRQPNVARMDGVSLSRSIVYGSIAFWLGKQASEFQSHQWTIYVRGLQGEDLSYFIKKVVFSLHPDFADSERVVDKPPFEVTETGWGEFNIGIRIFFIDETLPPVDIVHPLKLYTANHSTLNEKKPVVHEFYDELVFNDLPVDTYEQIARGPQIEVPRHPFMDHFGGFSEIADLRRIRTAQAYVERELAACRNMLIDDSGELTFIAPGPKGVDAQKTGHPLSAAGRPSSSPSGAQQKNSGVSEKSTTNSSSSGATTKTK